VLMRARGRARSRGRRGGRPLALVAFLFRGFGRLFNLGSHSSTGGAPIWDFAAAGLRWQFLTAVHAKENH